MFIKTTVYLDKEDLTALEIILLNEGKETNISGLIRKWIKGYLEKNGYQPKEIKISTVVSTKPESAIESMKKETEEVVKKVSKSEFCRHGIMINGFCNGCGGIAK